MLFFNKRLGLLVPESLRRTTPHVIFPKRNIFLRSYSYRLYNQSISFKDTIYGIV